MPLEEAIIHQNRNLFNQKRYYTFGLTRLKGFTVGRRVDVPIQCRRPLSTIRQFYTERFYHTL